MAPPPLLQVRNLHFGYGNSAILTDFCLEVAAGEIVALVGPNGVGKSTALCCIAGPEILGGHRPSGKIELSGTEVGTLTRTARARSIGYIPQHLPSAVDLTVDELAWLGRYQHLGSLGRRSQSDPDAVAAAILACELGALRRRPVRTLSGGERQRAYLASALSGQPSLLLLDEPTSALDLRHSLGLMQILEDGDAAVLMATHDLNLAARYADRVAVLWGQKVAVQGPPAKVLTPTLLREVYGVEVDVLEDPRTRRPVIIPVERAT